MHSNKPFSNSKRSSNSGPRINQKIRAYEVRLISADGEQLGIVSTVDALNQAEKLGFDLVEISPNATPPVCKIMDYGKYKYQQKRKANEAKKKQQTIEVKEVKFRPKTDIHDFNVKINRLKKFLDAGNKCKISIVFRGREIVHTDIGREVSARIIDVLKDFAEVESGPRMEGRQMVMIVSCAQRKNVKK